MANNGIHRDHCCGLAIGEEMEDPVIAQRMKRANHSSLPPEPTEEEVEEAYAAAIDW